MSVQYNVAVLGAKSTTGQTMLELLAEREFPIAKLYALGTAEHVDDPVMFGNKTVSMVDASEFDWSQAHIALFTDDAELAAQYGPVAAESGCVVIDNTTAFRDQPDIPLVIPEVNPHVMADFRDRNIISSPDGATIQMLVALKPIHDAVGLARINVATYQSVSGKGRQAISELAGQCGELLNGRPVSSNVFAKQIAFNALPQIDALQDNGYTLEEMRIVLESQKVLADPTIMINPTAVQIPVFYGYGEALHIETLQPLTAVDAKALLQQAAGVELCEDEDDYPTQVTEGSGQDGVYVGRVRDDISHPNGLNMWVVSDNVRKGSALNSIQIAELLIRDYL